MRFGFLSSCLAMCALSAGAGEASPRLLNAALPEYGARVALELPPDVRRNAETPPENAFDGNVHSRCVLEGAPYTFVVELLDKLPIEKLSFSASDYDKEEAAKEIVVELDDGTKLEQTLELKRPEKRKPAWQDLAIGKEVRSFKITVKSHHPGEVKWGGLGEVAVWTTADLSAKLALPGHDPAAPAYVDIPSYEQAARPEKVHMPPKAEPGQHPCLLLTPEELKQLKEKISTSERAKEAYEALKARGEEAYAHKVEFPDPKGPGAQLKDRGDPLAKQHDLLSKYAGGLGVAYALLGEKKYAEKAKEIVLGYAGLYEQYPVHKGVNRSDTSKVMAQRLSEAMWLIPQLVAFDCIHETLSEEERARIENGLIRPCLTMIHLKDPKALAAELDKSKPDWRSATPPRPAKPTVVGNWTNFYNLATIMGGAVLGDKDLVDLAVWDTKKNLQAGIGEDGMWGEGTIGYQMFALQALTAVLEVAARQGVDLWGFEDCRIKLPFDAVFRYAYPDGTCAGINDSGRARLDDWQAMIYDYAWLRYRDPAYAYLVNVAPRQLVISPSVYYPTVVYDKLPEPEKIQYPSTVFKTLGYAILRDPETFVLMDYGRHGGPHGHFDKLNLIVYAAGDELGGEPSMHRYEDPKHHEWTVQTVAHNTMIVDGRSQMACDGKLLCFHDAGPVKLMRGEAAGAYPGVLLDRTAVFTGDALVDLYRGASAREHDWAVTYRYRGQLVGADKIFIEGKELMPLGTHDGYQLLIVGEVKSAAELLREAWKTPKTELTVSWAGAPGQEAAVCLGPDQDHIVVLRQKAKVADFAAALQVTPWGAPVEKLRKLEDGGPGLAGAAFEKDGAETRVYVAHAAGAWKAGGFESDARVLVARLKDGKLERLVWSGGASAAFGGSTWTLEKPGNGHVAGENGELKLVGSWMP